MEFALLLLVGMLSSAFLGSAIGVVRERKNHRCPRPIPLPKVEPVCGCHHSTAFHDRAGKCHARDHYRYEMRRLTILIPMRCKCQKYIGPQPITEFFDPDL